MNKRKDYGGHVLIFFVLVTIGFAVFTVVPEEKCGYRAFDKSPFISIEIDANMWTKEVHLLLRGVSALRGAFARIPASRARIEVDGSLPSGTAVVSGCVGWVTDNFILTSYIYTANLDEATIFVSSLIEKERWEKNISDRERNMNEWRRALRGPEKPVPIGPPE